MNWEDEHGRRIASFPKGVREAHRRSIRHRAEIEAGGLCGCFYCGARYPPGEIVKWTDLNEDHKHQTALCPRCGIDSVIGDQSGFEISEEFLATMKRYWFGEE
jgi:hypothetical protein